MTLRKYYSARTRKPGEVLALDMLKELFFSVFSDFDARGYFDESFGKDCVDSAGRYGGTIENPENYILRKLRKKNIWPISACYNNYSDEDIFDVIEFLYDHVSKPLEAEAYFHGFRGCGFHYKKFNKRAGQLEFSEAINEFLLEYKEGYRLDVSGEIFTDQISERPLKSLLSAKLPAYDSNNIEDRMEEAVSKFKRHGSSFSERRAAVRALADCLEFLRPQLKEVLDKKDDADLFSIANNFGIRHHNKDQKVGYDQKIWLSWMFYFYLATLHAALRLLEQKRK